MNLTEYFNSLSKIDRVYNKYAAYSAAFNDPYRLATSYDAFKYDGFDSNLKRWIASQGKCIAMPNMIGNEVVSIMFRSCADKVFRYYTECHRIPYGAGFNEKRYSQPWIIVESVLDSDFIRNFYPFVIATNGVSVSKNTMEFLMGTSSKVYCGFDTDKAGTDSFHSLAKKYSNRDNNCFHIKRFLTPMSFEGKYLKDFGEIIDCLYNKRLDDYDYYVSSLKYSIAILD